jgi:ankyrin repeat protein
LKLQSAVIESNTDGWQGIHFAALGGNLEIVQTLAHDLKVDMNASESVGRRGIHFAAIGGHGDVIGFLLADDRVDPLVADVSGSLPLH